jgi:hypothetical protein
MLNLPRPTSSVTALVDVCRGLIERSLSGARGISKAEDICEEGWVTDRTGSFMMGRVS